MGLPCHNSQPPANRRPGGRDNNLVGLPGPPAHTWRGACRTLFLLSVLGIFFLLPVHSDPSVLILLSVVSGACAAGRCSLPVGPVRHALMAFTGYSLVAFVASAYSFDALAKYAIVPLWGGAIVAGMLFSRVFSAHGYRFFLATVVAIVLSLVAGVALGFHSPQFWHDFRLKLFAIHPSRLAMYCAVAFLFCCNTAAVAHRQKTRWLFIVLAALMAACLYMTNTRGVLLLLPFGILCLIVTLPAGRRHCLLAGFLVCCMFAGTGLWVTKETPLSKRVLSAVTDLRNDNTFRSRLPIWEAAWESFREAPFIGHGVKNYSQLHAKYREEHAQVWLKRYDGQYELSAKNAHNIILGRLVESGALGTVCFLLFYGLVTLMALRLPPGQRWVAALLVFYMGVGMLDDTLFRRNDTFIFFVMGAVLGQFWRQDTVAPESS